jgi:septum formation protein
MAGRLARAKAADCAAAHPGDLVIGSDQVAALGDVVLGKPGTPEKAVAQLSRCAGQTVTFYTAVCLLGPVPPRELVHIDETRVHFRQFSEMEARRYVAADRPLDCAGSFKAEQRGVILFERVENTDPTAIQGLPLIWLAAALRQFGLPLI